MKKFLNNPLVCIALFCFSEGFTQQNPMANFSVNKTAGCAPLTVNFINNSTNAVSYLWDFGDGASATLTNQSTLANPSHIYMNAGVYSVKLIAFAANGSADTVFINNLITVNARPAAAFTVANNQECVNGNPVMFVNSSSGAANFIWDFGDGSSDTLTSPSHIYSAAGTYSVALIAQNSYGCTDIKFLSDNVIISSNPSAEFSVDTTKFCSLNHPFQFSAADTGVVACMWNFGDGSSAMLTNVSHIFSTAGKYSVLLSITNQNGCTRSITKTNYITVSQEIEPVFSATNNTGCTPLNVSFSANLSPTLSYNWNFWGLASPNTSALPNPSQIYNDTGIFDVSLTVTDSYNCSFTYTADSLVNTNDVLNAAFSADFTSGCAPFTVHFADSSANANAWLWDFGDGSSAMLTNPSHSYSVPGNYSVSLKVNNTGGCESNIQKNNFIHVFGPKTEFTANDTVGCVPLSVPFYDSSMNAVQWFWDFGDGATSALQNPVHIYNNTGVFSVTLITHDSAGCSNTNSKANYIQVLTAAVNYNNTDTVFSCSAINASFNGSYIGNNFWLWDFGDGNFSTEVNPEHTYENPGSYSVSLTTQSAIGCSITLYNYNVYQVYETEVDFNFSVDTCPNISAAFVALSGNAVSWLWNLGDGAVSTEQNPIHAYSQPGFYSVALSLITENGCSNSTLNSNAIYITNCDYTTGEGGGMFGDMEQNAIDSLLNNQLQEPMSGCAPFKVSFDNPFNAAVAWHWNFGDGDTSEMESPVHSYVTDGIFTVGLTVYFANGTSDTLIRNNYIQVNKPTADFSVQHNNFCDGGEVLFTNLSSNANFYTWNFGDGGSATSTDTLSHLFVTSGNYLVKLTASDSMGCKTITAKNIFAGAPLYPLFAFEKNICIHDSILFLHNFNYFSSYAWDFGDGSFSTGETPIHTYDTAGKFIVSVMVADSGGCILSYMLDEITVNNPIANFSMSDTGGCSNLLVNFTNGSENADSCVWNFDGSAGLTNLGSAGLTSPTHIYTSAGLYSVSLIAMKNGCANEKIIPNAITVFEPSANFSFSQNTLCLPVTVAFSDSSKNAVSWFWNFGDGKTDSTKNPLHIFTEHPTQNIALSIIDSNGCTDSFSLPNINIFSSGFSASAQNGCDSLTVNFTALADNAVSWQWYFNNGDTSVVPNPTCFFADSGSYSITLIAEAPDGCKDTLTMPDYIQVYKVVADFNSLSELSGCSPLWVNFTDNSLNASAWKWSFGSGGTSTLKNPFHIYTMAGLYDVSLIASNPFGCSDTLVKNNFIQANGTIASFSVSANNGCTPLQIEFSDSSFNANELTWYFGDGGTSHLINPVHTYDSSGNFPVALLAADTAGCSSFYLFPQSVVVHPAPLANFVVADSSGCKPLKISFNAETFSADSMHWNFGDGDSAAMLSRNNITAISHTYTNAGIYHPLLVVSNNFGCTDTFTPPHVRVHPTPVADFTADTNRGCSPFNIHFTNKSQELNSPQFLWNFGNGGSSSDANPSTNFTEGGLFDVSLLVINEQGCSDSATKQNFIFTYDNIPPEPTGIIAVSVISNTSVLIAWNTSRAADFEKYVLYRKNNTGGNYEVVSDFSDSEISSYTDENLNTLKNSYCYKLLASDFCGNSKTLNEVTEYCSMNVTAKADSAEIHVQWTPYIGCSVSKYEIYRLEKGTQEFIKISAVAPEIRSYNDTTWHCYAEYFYKIKALDLCGNAVTALSDTSFARINENILANQKAEIIRSTVIDNAAVLTEWKPPALASEKVTAYKIFRSYANLKFEYITTVPSAANSYLDYAADVSEQNYYYKIVPENACKIQSKMSNNASSILLETESKGYDVKLKWTEYKHWENGVKHYIIEKQDENGNWKTIKVMDGNTFETDDSLLK